MRKVRYKNFITKTTVILFALKLFESMSNGTVVYAAMQLDTFNVVQSHKPIKAVADMDLQELATLPVSPFEVSIRLDSGYKASNTVSGSRFDVQIRELPFAIQAFTKSFIKDQKPVNIFDVARYSPGVTYRSNDFNEGNANLAIRGFTVGSLSGGNIQILRDGFYGPSVFDFTNISRVEVVKGPSSFLYGQVAPGGIVNIITKNPQSIFAVTASIRYGSYNQYRVETDITGPILKTLYYRLATSYDHDMEYWKPYNAYSLNVSPSLLWKPHERISVSVKYEHFYKNEDPQLMQKPGYNTQAGIVPTPSDPNLSGVDVPGLPDNWNSMSYVDFRHSLTDGVNAWIDYKVDNHWNLRVGYSYQKYLVDAVASGNFGMSNNNTFMQGRRYRKQTYSNWNKTLQMDGVGKYQMGGMSLRILIGGQYVNRDFDRAAGQAPNDPLLGGNPIASPLPLWDLQDPSTWNRDVTIPLDSLTASPFNQNITYNDRSGYIGTTSGFFQDRLLILAGWRYTSTGSCTTDNLKGASEPKITQGMVTPQYGLLFKLVHGVSFFASYAESFVPGTFFINNMDGTSSAAKPTKGKGFDAGFKTDFFGGDVSGTITCFDIKNKNIINDLSVTDTSGFVTIYQVQSGEQRSQGVELDATITASDNWQLYFSYSFIDARITKFSDDDNAILAQDPNTLDAAGRANYKNVSRFHHAPLQMSAPHLANIWSRYDFSYGLFRGIYIAGGVNYVYDQAILPDGPQSSHQTYALVNGIIGYSWLWNKIHFDADFMGKNLANEHYRPSQSSRSRPREFIFTLDVSF